MFQVERITLIPARQRTSTNNLGRGLQQIGPGSDTAATGHTRHLECVERLTLYCRLFSAQISRELRQPDRWRMAAPSRRRGISSRMLIEVMLTMSVGIGIGAVEAHSIPLTAASFGEQRKGPLTEVLSLKSP
jgi:hypothetical protein